MARGAGALLLVALVGGRNVMAQASEPFHVEDPSRWGTPTRVVLPEYPKEALAKRHTGYVEFEGVVGPLRDITALEFISDSPASEPFVGALKEVLPHWGFYPSLDRKCMPTAARVKTRVWFELEGEKPKITITRRRDLSAPAPAMVVPTFRRDPRYPPEAQREGYQAYVYSRMEVSAEGKVTQVVSEVYPKGNPGTRLFERETARAFHQWEFAPGPGRDVCMEIFYRLTG